MHRFFHICLVVAAFALVAGTATAAPAQLANNTTAPTATISSSPTAPTATATAAPMPTATPSPTATPAPTPTATPASTSSAPDRPNGTAIDSVTTLKSSRYFDGRGVVTVVIHSEIRQVITVNDAGTFAAGDSGQIPRRVVAMEPGETEMITVPVTEFEGYVGIGISTENTLYGVTLQAPSDALNLLKQASTLKAWVGGITIAFIWIVVAAWSELRREGESPVTAS